MSIFGLGFLSPTNKDNELELEDWSNDVEKDYEFLPLCCNNISRKNCVKQGHFLVPTSRRDECFVCKKENTFIVLECATYFDTKKKRDKATNFHSCAICFECAQYRGEVDDNGYPNGKGKLLKFRHKYKAKITKKVDTVVNNMDDYVDPDTDIKPIINDKKTENPGFILEEKIVLDPKKYYDESYWCHGFRHGVTNFKVANPKGFTGEEIQALFQVKRDSTNEAYGSKKILAFKYLPSHNAWIVETEKNSNQYKIINKQEYELSEQYKDKDMLKLSYNDVVLRSKRYIIADNNRLLYRRFLCIFALLDICKFSEVPDYDTLDRYYLKANNKNSLNFDIELSNTPVDLSENQELKYIMNDYSEEDSFRKTLEYRSLFKGRIPKTIKHLTHLEGIDLRGKFVKY